MFSGTFHHSIDPKGRVSVPVRFRDLLVATGRAQVMVTCCPLNPPPSLEAIPMPAWEEIMAKFLRLNRFDPKAMKFELCYIAPAHLCDIDNQGRILIPPELRGWATLTKDVVFTGAGDKFRIWDKQALEQSRDDAEAAFKADQTFVTSLDL